MSERRSAAQSFDQEAEDRSPAVLATPRTIVSAYILSSDDFLLMGRQDPSAGGTWPNALRIPGGGQKPGESLKQAMLREAHQEVLGLELGEHELIPLPVVAESASAKTLENGETIWQRMVFYHFAVLLDKPAADYNVRPGSDLTELAWLDREERAEAEQIPLGRAMMLQAGIIDRPMIESC